MNTPSMKMEIGKINQMRKMTEFDYPLRFANFDSWLGTATQTIRTYDMVPHNFEFSSLSKCRAKNAFLKNICPVAWVKSFFC